MKKVKSKEGNGGREDGKRMREGLKNDEESGERAKYSSGRNTEKENGRG